MRCKPSWRGARLLIWKAGFDPLAAYCASLAVLGKHRSCKPASGVRSPGLAPPILHVGTVAEWLGAGLQSQTSGFDSRRYLSMPGSSNGRAAALQAADGGSIPSPGTVGAGGRKAVCALQASMVQRIERRLAKPVIRVRFPVDARACSRMDKTLRFERSGGGSIPSGPTTKRSPGT